MRCYALLYARYTAHEYGAVQDARYNRTIDRNLHRVGGANRQRAALAREDGKARAGRLGIELHRNLALQELERAPAAGLDEAQRAALRQTRTHARLEAETGHARTRMHQRTDFERLFDPSGPPIDIEAAVRAPGARRGRRRQSRDGRARLRGCLW
jgi:hypothetical protein